MPIVPGMTLWARPYEFIQDFIVGRTFPSETELGVHWFYVTDHGFNVRDYECYSTRDAALAARTAEESISTLRTL